VYTGARPGEKLFEELTTQLERATPTAHPKVFVARATDLSGARLEAAVEGILAAAREGDAERVVALLREAVPWEDAVDADARGPGVPAS
jgi:FlaA1/EpsC-like NDP-sugar epimerase